ncbi:ATP-grasp ribosomal peptide maturase [Salinispora arenicola]|uniref:ATP-grasp ribosomal peptide maturase n=1 Tax=Salinispora arenicola TaxID=168697 RepID=UPI00037F7C07|nr:ATP-grasp ribosomal peptide maturase [Salinispora arenicola]
MAVLILTHPLDVTVDPVIKHLHDVGQDVVRFDTADFPQRLHLSATWDGAWIGALCGRHRTVRLSDITAVYYRRPTPFVLPDDMSDDERAWAHDEALHGFGGVLTALPAVWVNRPDRVAAADFKPRQLSLAHHAGMTTPRTIITNMPAAAKAFAESCPNGLIYKTLTGSPKDAGLLHTTSTVTVEQAGDPGIAHTAHLLQEQVPKAFEVRLTVAGEQLFAARIDTHSDAAALDWRSDYDALTYQPTTIPSRVDAAVRRFMAMLHLRFAAIDFVVRPDGEWVFLEVNPNGQWGWIEQETDLPIAAAIAAELSRERV